MIPPDDAVKSKRHRNSAWKPGLFSALDQIETHYRAASAGARQLRAQIAQTPPKVADTDWGAGWIKKQKAALAGLAKKTAATDWGPPWIARQAKALDHFAATPLDWGSGWNAVPPPKADGAMQPLLFRAQSPVTQTKLADTDWGAGWLKKQKAALAGLAKKTAATDWGPPWIARQAKALDQFAATPLDWGAGWIAKHQAALQSVERAHHGATARVRTLRDGLRGLLGS
jgi:hypothetical protein